MTRGPRRILAVALPEHLPKPEDDQLVWIQFALTFDGYAEKGTQEICAAFANAARDRWEEAGTLPAGLSDLRAALFYEQRRWRWSDEAPFTERQWRYWRSLVDAIRHALFSQDKLPVCEIEPQVCRPSNARLAKNVTTGETLEPSPMERTIDLFSETDAHGGSRHVWLRLTKKGELILEGQDLGGAAPKLFGPSEYEWAWTLAPERLSAFLESLGLEACLSAGLLVSVTEALNKLERTKIQKVFEDAGAKFWNRIGD